MLSDHKTGPRFPNVHSILAGFAALNLIVPFALLLLRAGQYVSMSARHAMPAGSWFMTACGLLNDILAWQVVAWCLLIPFILLSLLRRWLGYVFFGLVFGLAILLEWGLFEYYRMELTPLDQVVYSYTFTEMKLIVGSSLHFTFAAFLPFLLIPLLPLGVVLASRRFRVSRCWMAGYFLASLTALFLAGMAVKMEWHGNDFHGSYLPVNKTAYLIEKILEFRSSSNRDAPLEEVAAATRRYHQAHPEFEFTRLAYPFLHTEKTADVLGPLLNLGKEKPNMVFIIVESLSPSFIGPNPIYGSFTPFLDSLAGNSLFWNCFLATSDRTFNVLPALFASLPPGDPTFITEVSKIPYHFSLIRELKDVGYSVNFFYAGDPTFNYMEDFLKRQETDYILRYFGPRYGSAKMLIDGYHWGHPDGNLFARSLEAIDSLKQSLRLDIYLTLSLHSPFLPPNREHYLRQVDQRLATMEKSMRLKPDIEKNRDIFASVLYTDDALRKFFDQYSKRADFANTVFFITGDHGIPELNLTRFSPLAKYNVPFIIYSPMLRHPRLMRSVSSHLDVAPSVLAMMNTRYGMKRRPLVAWLGKGIDTAAAPGNRHILAFIMNNKEILEYVNGDLFLFRDTVYRILPEFWMKDTADAALKERMTAELADFRMLNSYVTRQNRLIPREVYFEKRIDSIAVPVRCNLYIDPNDSTGEFRNLFTGQKIPAGLKVLRMDISLDYQTTEEDPRKAPILVFDLYGGGKQLLWQSYDLPCHRKDIVKHGKWKRLTMTEYVEISYLKHQGDFNLKLYLWNQRQCRARFSNPVVRITGYR